MRKIVNLIKTSLKKLDGQWIESAGHPIFILGVIEYETTDPLYLEKVTHKHIYGSPILVYGIYEYSPTNAMTAFGIDEPDELNIEVNYDILIEKLKMLPKIGTLLKVEEENWVVANYNWVYDKFIGKKRLNLTCRRYQESATCGIQMKDKDNDTQN